MHSRRSGRRVVNVKGGWFLVVASERFENPPSKNNRKKKIKKKKKNNKTQISKKHNEMLNNIQSLFLGG